MSLLDVTVRLRGILPVISAGDLDRERSIVEPRGHPDQVAAGRLPVVRLPVNPISIGKLLGMDRSRDRGAVAGRPAGACHGGRSAGENLLGTAVNDFANLVRPVR